MAQFNIKMSVCICTCDNGNKSSYSYGTHPHLNTNFLCVSIKKACVTYCKCEICLFTTFLTYVVTLCVKTDKSDNIDITYR